MIKGGEDEKDRGIMMDVAFVLTSSVEETGLHIKSIECAKKISVMIVLI